MSTPVNLPLVNMAFVDGKGMLTEYGRQMLNGLRNRTGGTDGIDIKDLQTYINQQIQEDREAPVSTLVQPPLPPDDKAPQLAFPAIQEDNPGVGLLLAYIRKLEARISELEEAPQWRQNTSP